MDTTGKHYGSVDGGWPLVALPLFFYHDLAEDGSKTTEDGARSPWLARPERVHKPICFFIWVVSMLKLREFDESSFQLCCLQRERDVEEVQSYEQCFAQLFWQQWLVTILLTYANLSILNTSTHVVKQGKNSTFFYIKSMF